MLTARGKQTAAVLGTGVGYWAAGKLALFMAIPPGYATAVWPAAGLAVVAVLLWGRTVAVGVAVGSFLVNAPHALEGGDVVAVTKAAWVSGAIGLGAAAQALAGAALIERHVGFPNALEEERDIAKFLGLGGPVACVVNATVSTTMLCTSGLVRWADAPFHWATWWIGDTIGVLIFAPLVLTFVGTPAHAWRPRRALVGGPLIVGFLVTTALFLRASDWEEARVRARFDAHAAQFAYALSARLSAYEDVAVAAGAYLHMSPDVSGAGFREFLEPFLRRYPELERAQWDPVELRRDPLHFVRSVDVAKAALQGHDTSNVRLSLRDAASRSPLGSHVPERQVLPRSGLRFERELSLGPRRFHLDVVASDGYVAARRSWQAWLVLGGGLSFVGLLGALLLMATGGTLRARRLHMERLQREQQFRLAIEASPTGMLMVSRDGKIVLANTQLEKLFGYEHGELLGKSVESLVPERFRAGHPEYRRGFFAAPGARSMGAGRDLYGLRKDGTEIPIEIGLNPIETGEGAFVLSSIADITERKRNERLTALALTQKETLLKEIHHRVRNNLQVISSLLRLQAHHVGDADVHAALTQSQSRVQSIALVHEKLYLDESSSLVRFDEYVREFVGHLLGVQGAAERGVSCAIEAPALRLPVEAAIPCGLIISELVTNALKYAFVGRAAGTIGVGVKTDGPWLQVTVADDGIGLPRDVNPDTTDSLGLSLVARFAKQLHADVRVSRDRGTQFEVRFRR